MPFRNPLASNGGELTQPEFSSPGFSPSAFNGWMINRLGQAQFNSVILRNLSTIQTAHLNGVTIVNDAAFPNAWNIGQFLGLSQRPFRASALLAASISPVLATASTVATVTHQMFYALDDGSNPTDPIPDPRYIYNTSDHGANNQYLCIGTVDTTVSAAGTATNFIGELDVTNRTKIFGVLGTVATVTDVSQLIFVGTTVNQRQTISQAWLVTLPPIVYSGSNGTEVFADFTLKVHVGGGTTTYIARNTHTNLRVMQVNTPVADWLV